MRQRQNLGQYVVSINSVNSLRRKIHTLVENIRVLKNKFKILKSIPEQCVTYGKLRRYLECPRQHREVTSDKKEGRGSVNSIFGSSFHLALEYYNKTKIDNEEPDLEIMKDIFKQAMQSNNARFFPREHSEVMKQGLYLLHRYHDELRATEFTEAEKEFQFSVDGIPVIGRIDLIAGEHIIDYKTSHREPFGDEADISSQLSLYTLAYWAYYKRWPKTSRLLWFSRKEGNIYYLGGRRTVGQVENIVELIKDYWKNKNRKVAVPGTYCKWCPVSKHCPAMPIKWKGKNDEY